MSGFSNYLVTKTGFLVRTVVKSVNFVTGVSGWAIFKNGNAEFNSVTIRGGEVISGTNLYYSGTPALGNLVASESAAGGTDAKGNVYLPGNVTYSGGGVLAVAISGTAIQAWSAPGPAGPWSATGGTISVFATNFNVSAPAGISLGGGPVVATAGTAALPTVITTDTPHSVTPPTGMTGTIVYQLLSDNMVSVDVRLAVASTVAAGTVALITGLGSAYQPARDQRGGGVGFFPNGTPSSLSNLTAITQMRWEMTTAGTLNVLAFVGGAAGSGVTEMDFTITYPLT